MIGIRFQTALAQVTFCGALLTGSAAMGATLSLDAVDQGWYRNDGSHTPSNLNTLTGRLSNGREYRSWYGFDLTADPGDGDSQETALSQADAGRITAATLVFAAGNGLARSQDQSETLEFYDVTADKTQLRAGQGGLAAFDDLGSGRQYGSVEYATVGNTLRAVNEISVTLDAEALEDLNASLATGEAQFYVGAVLSSLSSQQRSEYLWAWSRLTPAVQLNLEIAPVPLPAGLPLLAGALGGLWLVRRKRLRTGAACT